MSFQAVTKKQDATTWKIDIYLQGINNSLADAADLRLNFAPHLKIDDLNTGDSFPLYPRVETSEESLLVTGVAAIRDNHIDYGKPGSVFVSFNVTIPQDSSLPYSIKADLDTTKIYFSGQDIFNRDAVFPPVILK